MNKDILEKFQKPSKTYYIKKAINKLSKQSFIPKLSLITFILLTLSLLTYFIINKIFNINSQSNTYAFYAAIVLIISLYLFLTVFLYDIRVNKNKNLIYIILITLLVAMISSLLMQFLQFGLDINATLTWLREKYRVFLINALVIFSILMTLISLISLYWGIVIGFIFFMIISVVNLVKIKILGQPLYAADFYQIKNLNSLADYVGISMFSIIFISFLVVSVIFYISLKFKKYKLRNMYKLITALFFIGIIGNSMSSADINAKNLYTFVGANYCSWDQTNNYYENGLIYSILSNLGIKTIDKPDNYSKEEISKIVEKYEEKAKIYNSKIIDDNKKPNIIYIMSESFWDPTTFNFLKFSEDPMKNIRNFTSDNYILGNHFSSAIGTSTANIEYEALTGFSMYNLKSGSVPYQQSINKFFPSIVNLLKGDGYKTYAVHPFNKSFYKRTYVYDNFGIDEFISHEKMKNVSFLSDVANISDESMMKEIESILEENDEPVFIHGVTMQNHMDYHKGKSGKESVDISWDGLSDSLKELIESYTEGIKQSDIVMKKFIDYVDKLKEPTMIVFFGDHEPYFVKNDSFMQSDLFKNMDPLEKESFLSKTPLFYYANFEIKDKEIDTLGSNYISLTTYELLNKKIPPFYAMLQDLEDEFKGLKKEVILDSNSNVLKEDLTSEQKTLLDEYKLIQYDITEGKRYSLKSLFYVRD